MIARRATPYSRGIDTVQKLTSESCRFLLRAGVDFVIRYLHGRYAITAEELDLITRSGLSLMLVTPSRAPGWFASLQRGRSDGDLAVAALTELGVPLGCTIWLDLEGCASSSAEIKAWCEAWARAVTGAGFEAGVYVGHGAGLDSDQLWELIGITRYWRSGSCVAEPSHRGWCLQQLRPLDVAYGPLRVDHDVIELDYRGGLPLWISR